MFTNAIIYARNPRHTTFFISLRVAILGASTESAMRGWSATRKLQKLSRNMSSVSVGDIVR
jgi:hypothetical protein